MSESDETIGAWMERVDERLDALEALAEPLAEFAKRLEAYTQRLEVIT